MQDIIAIDKDSALCVKKESNTMEKSLQKSIIESLEYTNNHEGIYLSGENKTTKHQIFELNEFYIEMVDRLKKLRLDYADEEEEIDEGDSCESDNVSLLTEVVNAIKRKRNDPEIKKQIETILNLDMEIAENDKTLKFEMSDRQSYQNDICAELNNEENLDKYSEKLYELCKFDSEPRQTFSKSSICPKENKAGGTNCKKSAKSEENKFIRRNIELAKNSQEMGNLSLTDEEKIKLENLLVDVDTIADDGNTTVVEDDDTSQDTGYHFDDDERSLLDALDEKLKDFGKYASLGESADGEQAEKFWKIEQRLRNIEEELLNYQADKDKFSEKEEEKLEVADTLLKCPPEIEPTDDMKEMAMKLVESYEKEYGIEPRKSADETSDFEDGSDDTENRCFFEEYDEDELDIIRRVREITTADE